MKLELALASGKTVAVEVPEGSLRDFMARQGRFEGDWIEVKSGRAPRYVRYDQIVEVLAIPAT